MQMQFDLDYLGHSATLSFPSDDTHMHNAAVSLTEMQHDTAVLYAAILSFSLLQLCYDSNKWKKKSHMSDECSVPTNLVWQSRSALS